VTGAVVLAALLLAADTRPIGTLPELGAALAACVRGDAPAAGSQLEVRFTLSARGTLQGKPVVVLARAVTSMAAERDLKATVLDALRRCTPFSLSPAFARAVAGRSLTLKVLTGGRAVVV
jgi:hypothetical protein